MGEYQIRWQPGPRRPWRTLRWGDLGMRVAADQPFVVPTLEQAAAALATILARGARAEIVPA